MRHFYIAGTAMFLAWACSPLTEAENTILSNKALKYVSEWTHAPLEALEVPFHQLQYISEHAKQWILPNGTKIDIPAQAFALNGKPYKGPVEVQYRNFNSAAEIMRSGIPMAYQNGVLESAGMFEMRAFTPSGDLLDVAQNKAIDIQMPSDKVDTNYMFYAFDEKSGTWIEDGKPKTTLSPQATQMLAEEELLQRVPKNTPFQLSEQDLKLETKTFLSYMYYPINESDYPKMMQWLKKGLKPKLIIENESDFALRFGGDKKVAVYPIASEAEKAAALVQLSKAKLSAQQKSAFYINDETYIQNTNGQDIALSYRSMQITNMGIFNCDRLNDSGIPKEMLFVDETFDPNTKVYLVFDKSGVQQVYPSGERVKFRYDPKQYNEIFVIHDNELLACKIDSRSKQQEYSLEKLADIDEYFDADEFDAYVENY